MKGFSCRASGPLVDGIELVNEVYHYEVGDFLRISTYEFVSV